MTHDDYELFMLFGGNLTPPPPPPRMPPKRPKECEWPFPTEKKEPVQQRRIYVGSGEDADLSYLPDFFPQQQEQCCESA